MADDTLYVVDSGTTIYGPFHGLQAAAVFKSQFQARYQYKVVPLTPPVSMPQQGDG